LRKGAARDAQRSLMSAILAADNTLGGPKKGLFMRFKEHRLHNPHRRFSWFARELHLIIECDHPSSTMFVSSVYLKIRYYLPYLLTSIVTIVVTVIVEHTVGWPLQRYFGRKGESI